MRILVCLKQVPDTTEVKLSSQFTLQRDFVAQILNPADESALELALTLRDQQGGSVTVITMGPARAESMLRDALARGANEAVHLTGSAFAGADTLVTAQCLAAAIRHLGGFDCILCGRRSIDGETGQVGPMLASLLDIPCIVNCTDGWIKNHWIHTMQLTENGQITWQTPLPALITCCEWTHRLRLPTILGLKKAKSASILYFSPQDLGIESCGLKASPTRVVHVETASQGARNCQKMGSNEVLQILMERGLLP